MEATARAAGSATDPQLKAKWKREIRKRPLAQQAAWLQSDEGRAAFSSRQLWEKLRHVRDAIRELMSSVPSSSWLRAAEQAGEPFPPPGMVLSRGLVRIGDSTIATRRFTPRIAIEVEDLLDQLDVLDAARYRHPPSITGLQMELIRWRRGRDRGERRKTIGSRRALPRTDSSRSVELGFGERGITRHAITPAA